MTQHPTKEQVEAARRVVFGEIAGRGEILQVRQVLLGLPDPLAGEMSTQELAGRILAAALASAERDAERFRVLASHIKGPIRRDGFTFINWAAEVSDGTFGPKVFSLGELADALAAQRKEGE